MDHYATVPHTHVPQIPIPRPSHSSWVPHNASFKSDPNRSQRSQFAFQVCVHSLCLTMRQSCYLTLVQKCVNPKLPGWRELRVGGASIKRFSRPRHGECGCCEDTVIKCKVVNSDIPDCLPFPIFLSQDALSHCIADFFDEVCSQWADKSQNIDKAHSIRLKILHKI